MKVEIYSGLGTRRHLVWKGTLDMLPRVGENVVPNGVQGYTVERIHHWLAEKRVEIYAR